MADDFLDLARRICGIDPGLSGAIARISDEIQVYDMPVLHLSRNGKNKREIDAVLLADLLQGLKPDHAFVEQIGAMPGQGVTSVFAFGKSYGIVIGVLAALQIPVTFVAPRKWKATLKVPASKDGARARASELMPRAASNWQRAKDEGRAEAALIALYGQQSQVGRLYT